MLILADTPRAKAAEILRCNEKSLSAILSYWVNEAVSRQDLKGLVRLAVDEISRLRGHDYVTVFVDADGGVSLMVNKAREKRYLHLAEN